MGATDKPSPSVNTAVAGGSEPEKLNVIETPTSPSSAFAMSRFEFEKGRGNEGTKILMVEWDTAAAAAVPGPPAGDAPHQDWEVSWEGKTHVLPIRDTETDSDSGSTRRVYFLLPPGAPVPTLINISQRVASAAKKVGPTLRTKPMPAIFPEGLPGTRIEAGRRGVLHTIWAKKRLSELQAEIETEAQTNGESVGLEMAIQERQWIVDHFGLAGGEGDGVPRPSKLHIPQAPQSPLSPRSPIGGKLGEKLKGLKLATSPTELAAATEATRSARIQPGFSLGPAAGDMAVSSYASFGGRTAAAAAPRGDVGAVGSLNAIVGGNGVPPNPPAAGGEVEDELFALPMSPRSPEMKRSPFSML